MYNPIGNDNNYEFLELYSEEQITLNNAYFEGIDLEINNYTFQGRIVLTRSTQGFFERYNQIPNFTYSGNLINSGEKIILWENSSNLSKLAELEYFDIANEGYSIINENSQIKVGKVLHGTPFEAEPESGEECNYNFDFNLSNTVINNGETLEFSPITNYNQDFNLTYWVEDIDGGVLKAKSITSNKNVKKFTPKIKNNQILFLKGVLEFSCNGDIHKLNGLINFVVKNNQPYLNLEIESKPRYGENITLSIESYNYKELKIVLGGINNISINPKTDLIQKITLNLPENCDNKLSKYQNITLESENNKISKETLIYSNSECTNPKIKKLYTLSQKNEIGKNITYYVSFENNEKGDEIILSHNNKMIPKSLMDEISPLKFNIILEEKNLLRAEMRRSNQILDVVEDILILNNTLDYQTEELTESLNTNLNSDSKQKESLITAKSTLETKSNKKEDLNLIPKIYYAFLGLSLIGNIILMWRG
ncbi:hypothetical protein COU54_00475 [Candidatus Pacearchaeota archaeon CG10_big_fil_rev_8_21_14_0_10_31_24]|nr:MAG: hypothetical protein COU54_00475 [Candidatus Pacearchaeota archaeon CG10_big_fil_rev_8_21_14_0_10_31_24]